MAVIDIENRNPKDVLDDAERSLKKGNYKWEKWLIFLYKKKG